LNYTATKFIDEIGESDQDILTTGDPLMYILKLYRPKFSAKFFKNLILEEKYENS